MPPSPAEARLVEARAPEQEAAATPTERFSPWERADPAARGVLETEARTPPS